ncbi:MAG: TlpA family protein disulfide reductase [Candidatus Caldatribacteriaceae bacterium]
MRKGTAIAILFVLLLTSLSWASIRKLPSFNLYTLRGEEIPFCPKNLTALFFIDPTCLSCLVDLLQLSKILEEGKIPLYPVCLQCNFRNVQRLEDSLSGRFTIYFAHPSLPALLGIWETPVLFLVNSEGKVLYQEKGRISLEAFQSFMASYKSTYSSKKRRNDNCSAGICY